MISVLLATIPLLSVPLAAVHHAPPADTRCTANGRKEKVNCAAKDNYRSIVGLCFSDSLQKFRHGCPPPFQGVQVDFDIPDEEEFKAELSVYLDKLASRQCIEDIKEAVVSFFQERNYPIVAVFFPSGQDCSKGNFSFLILVGKLGSVHAEGARWFSNDKIASMIHTKPGEDITADRISADMDWINQNPFRSTTLVYQPGSKLGETDILLVSEDRFPCKVYAGYENTGTVTVGTNRILAGLSCGRMFGLDHQFNGLFITDTPFKEWWASVGNYTIPLPWRHLFYAYGSYTQTDSRSIPSFHSTGKGWVMGGTYNIPFFFSAFKNEFLFGYEFKRTNNFLTFNVVNTVFNQYVDISQFILGYDGSLEYASGSSAVSLRLYISPGGMTSFNKTSIFDEERAGANAQYLYGLLKIDQVFLLPAKCSWVLNSAFQLSTSRLLPSEEFPLGGYYTVRGYDEYALISDEGVLVKNELRSPAFHLPSWKKRKHELQVLGFVDLGLSIEIDPSIYSRNYTTLASIGPGIRYNLYDILLARLDVGVQLHHIDRLQENTPYHARVHFGATLSY